jgi:hypothetical protein
MAEQNLLTAAGTAPAAQLLDLHYYPFISSQAKL